MRIHLIIVEHLRGHRGLRSRCGRSHQGRAFPLVVSAKDDCDAEEADDEKSTCAGDYEVGLFRGGRAWVVRGVCRFEGFARGDGVFCRVGHTRPWFVGGTAISGGCGCAIVKGVCISPPGNSDRDCPGS